MSTDAYGRATAREGKIWSPFLYSFPFDDNQTTDRKFIYGLYASTYLNAHGYLAEVEATELTNLLGDYNSKLAELSAQEQVLVADIVSKRYIASIDKLIHDNKLVTKSAEINANDAMWTAKIAALAADRAALDTLAAKVTTETEKTNARVSELQAYIQTEAVNLSEVDLQIAEKAIQSGRVDIEKLNTANAILKIQADTVNTASQLVEVDLQIARARVDIAHADASIAKIGLLEDDLTVAQAQTAIDEGELPVAEARTALAKEKLAEADKEKAYHEVTLPAQASTEYDNKLALMNARDAIKRDELDQVKDERELNMNNRRLASDLDITFADQDAHEQAKVDAMKVNVRDWQVINRRDKVEAAVAVAETLASANIVTTLTHNIQKASAE